MKQVTINLYSFNELSEDAKEKAKRIYYENEDYPFLDDNLTERCIELLDERKVKHEDIKLLYSLSSCQGDGLCFTGTISKDGNELRLTHNYRYYFANSVTMQFVDKSGEEVDEIPELSKIYFEVCKILEDAGYAELEYRMTDEEFSEHCEANEYTFEEDGTMNNG